MLAGSRRKKTVVAERSFLREFRPRLEPSGPSAVWRRSAAALLASSALAGCSSSPDSQLVCGEGTVERNGECVAVTPPAPEAGLDAEAGIHDVSVDDGATDDLGTLSDSPDVRVDGVDDVGVDTTPLCFEQCNFPGCGGCPAVPMVRVTRPDGGTYEIDSVETRQADYAEFLRARVPPQTDAECSWNDRYEPEPADPSILEYHEGDDLPQYFVDWCDARAYCKWATKRLCTHTPHHPGGDPDADEWGYACSAGWTQDFAYGPMFRDEICNDGALEGYPRPWVVGASYQCEGGYPNLYDMLGNVSEWTASAAPPDPRSSWVRGTDFQYKQRDGCSKAWEVAADAHMAIGIRCCR